MKVTFTSLLVCFLFCTEVRASTYCDSLSAALTNYSVQNAGNSSLDNLVWSLDNTFGYNHYDSASGYYVYSDAPYWYAQITSCGLSFPTIINCAQADTVLQHFYNQYPQWRYTCPTAIWTTYLNENNAANGYWNSAQSWTMLLGICGYSYPAPDTPLTQCDSLNDGIGLYAVQYPSGSDFNSFTNTLNGMWGYGSDLNYWHTVYSACGDTFPAFINCAQADTVMNHFYTLYPQYVSHAPAFLWANYLNQNSPTPTGYQYYAVQDWITLLGTCGISYPAPDTLATFCDSLQVADSLYIRLYPNGASPNQFANLLNSELGSYYNSYTGWIGVLSGCGLACPHTVNCTYVDSLMTTFKTQNPQDTIHAAGYLWMGYLNTNNAQIDNSWYVPQDWQTMLSCCGISYPAQDTLANYCDSLSAEVTVYNDLYPNGSNTGIYIGLLDASFGNWGYDSGSVWINNTLQTWYTQTNACSISCPHIVSCTLADSILNVFYSTYPQDTAHAPAFVWTQYLNTNNAGQANWYSTQDWQTMLGCCGARLPFEDTITSLCDSIRAVVSMYNSQNPYGSNLWTFTNMLNSYIGWQHYDSASGQVVNSDEVYWINKLHGCGLSCPNIVNCSTVSSLMSSFYIQYPQYDSAAPDIFWTTYLNENNAGADNFGNGWTYNPTQWKAILSCCGISYPAPSTLSSHCDTINTVLAAIPGFGTNNFNLNALVNELNELYGWQHYDSTSGQQINNNLAYWLPVLSGCGYSCSKIFNCDSITAAMNELAGYYQSGGSSITYSSTFTILYLGIRFPNYNLDSASWVSLLSCCSPPSINSDSAMSYCEEVEILRIACQYNLPTRSCLPAWVSNYMLSQFEPSFANLKDTTVGLLCTDLTSCKMTCLSYCNDSILSSCDSINSVAYVYHTLLVSENATVDTTLLDNVYTVMYNQVLPYNVILSQINNCNPADSAVLTKIVYTAANLQYTTNGSHTYIEFDLLATDTPSNLLFSQSNVFVQYDSTVFGTSLVGNGLITATKGNAIDSPYYNLAISDSTPTMLKLAITHTPNPASLANLANVNQQLCHLKIDISGFNLTTVGAYFDTVAMAGRSEFNFTPHGLEFPYDRIEVRGLNGLRSSNNPIYYQIANPDYTTVAGKLVFNIQAESPSGLNFYSAHVAVDYSSYNFGSNVAPGKLSCKQTLFGDDGSGNIGGMGTNGGNPIYGAPSVSNLAPSTFQVEVNASNTYYNLNNPISVPSILSFTTIATCTLTVVNCCDSALSGYLFINTGSSSGQYAYLDTNSYQQTDAYDTIIDNNDFDNNGLSICNSSNPIIADVHGPDPFDPLTIVSGSFDVLTITGCGFGYAKGQVLFPDADNGGASMMHTQLPDIQSWSDNTITTWVPSVQDSTGHTAGTGQIQIVDAFGDTSALSGGSLSLHIPYSLLNTRYPGTYQPYPDILLAIDSSFGYIFTPANYITGDTLAVVTKALNDWACQTGIQFKMGAPTNTPVVNPLDSVNTILYGALPAGVGMRTRIRQLIYTPNPPCTSNSLPAAIIPDIDIVISNSSNFYISTNDADITPAGQNSLLSEARHEFGHASGLKHVINLGDVMYYTDPGAGNPPALIAHDDQNGGIYELQLGATYLNHGCYNPQIFPAGCPTLAITNGISTIQNSGNSVSVYPNPFTENISIDVSANNEGTLKVYVYDLLGQIVSFNDFGMVSGYVQESISTSSFRNGAYVIVVSLGNQNTQLKMIKLTN